MCIVRSMPCMWYTRHSYPTTVCHMWLPCVRYGVCHSGIPFIGNCCSAISISEPGRFHSRKIAFRAKWFLRDTGTHHLFSGPGTLISACERKMTNVECGNNNESYCAPCTRLDVCVGCIVCACARSFRSTLSCLFGAHWKHSTPLNMSAHTHTHSWRICECACSARLWFNHNFIYY